MRFIKKIKSNKRKGSNPQCPAYCVLPTTHSILSTILSSVLVFRCYFILCPVRKEFSNGVYPFRPSSIIHHPSFVICLVKLVILISDFVIPILIFYLSTLSFYLLSTTYCFRFTLYALRSSLYSLLPTPYSLLSVPMAEETRTTGQDILEQHPQSYLR